MKGIEKLTKKRSLSVIYSLVLVLLIIGTVLIYNFYFSRRIESKLINNIYSQNAAVTLNATEYIDEHFEHSRTLVFGVQSFIDTTENATKEEVDEYLDDLLLDETYLQEIRILSVDGITEYVYPHNENIIGTDYSQNSDIQSLTTVHMSVWTAPEVQVGDTLQSITLIFRSEQKYIIAKFSLEFFEHLYTELFEVNENKGMMILNEFGIILYDSNSSKDEFKMRYELFDSVVDEIDNTNAIVLEVNDKDSIISIRELESQNWYVTIYESQATSDVLISELSIIFWIIILIVIGLFVFISIHFIFIVTLNLRRLKGNLDIITEGDYGYQIKDANYLEFKRISDAFNKMSTMMSISHEKLSTLAFIDNLTNLYSRNFMRNDFEKAVENNPNLVISFFYIDLSRFHIINETFGYDMGDELLKAVAKRLKDSLNPLGTIGRLESDEFLIVCKSGHDPETSAKAIVDEFKDPFILESNEFTITPNVGVSKYPENGKDFEEVILNATIALLESKKDVDKKYYLFEDAMLSKYQRQLDIELAIDDAFTDRDFYVEFQPVLDIKTEKIRGFEALCRWNHKTLGQVNPNEFIGKLEELNKIHVLDKYVLKESMKQINRLFDRYNKKFVLSVNISGQTILRDDFVSMVKEALRVHSFDPSCLELELTETVFIHDYTKIKRVMNQLGMLGVKFSEDDFGDGYSSLNYLAELEISTLKISRTILMNLKYNVNNRILVETIVSLSKQLGFETIVEGVEDKEMLEIFKELDCNFVQGYYFYRPLNYTKLQKELDTLFKRA